MEELCHWGSLVASPLCFLSTMERAAFSSTHSCHYDPSQVTLD